MLAATLTLVGGAGLPARQQIVTVARGSRLAVMEQAEGPSQQPTLRLAEADVANLEWRTVGPAVTSGRIVDFAVAPTDTDVIYVATAGGGVFKSVDGGIMWRPIFDQAGSLSIGGIAVAPSNPNVVWVATGEPNGRNLVSTSWGDGVYRSEDGGETWQNIGLENCQQTGRVRVHSEDPDIAWVPCLGALWDTPEDNATRGLWMVQVVAGEEPSWSKVLSAGDRGGFVDLDVDPRDGRRLYATSWQRERKDWSWLSRGPESGVFRSDDGGASWERVASGLPEGDAGRYGVSVCRSDPDVVYVVAEAEEGGVYRSDNRGATFELVNADVRSSQYYGQIRCDPNDPDRVYVLSTRMSVSDDGGHTFSNDLIGAGVHVDHHALWIDPGDSDHLLLGNDGGVYLSRDRGDSWRFVSTLSITQFYEVGYDLREPFYYVYGGTQDNNSWGGPSATRNADGIVNDDWYMTTGGDGFYTRIDPSDPTIVYAESQHGGLVRFDTRTGQRKRLKPSDPEEGDPYRWNWSAPLLISQHDPAVIYFGAQVLFRSPNRGDTWEVISPDLTRGLTYDNLMNDFGTLRVIAESPFDPSVLAVGADDGLVQVTRDGGETWQQTEGLPGVPELALVRRLVLSAHDPETIYVASSYHEYNDFTPYLSKSTDFGRSWTSIVANLPPDEPIRAFAEHPRQPSLLFVGTERGVWASVDGGGHWVSLRNNLPRVPIHDLTIHPRENDLIIGTHGRGIWILDDITMLEEMAAGVLADDVLVFAPRSALQLRRNNRGRGSQGHAYFRAPNPPNGAIIDYRVSPDLFEPAATEAGADEGPEPDASPERQEPERPPRIELDILDADGGHVRRLEVPQGRSGAGSHRVVWDLSYGPTWLAAEGEEGTVDGPWVLPGEYRIRLRVGEAVSDQRITVRPDPLVSISANDRRAWHDTQVALAELLAAARAATARAWSVDEAIGSVQRAVEVEPEAAAAIEPQIDELADRLQELRAALRDASGTLSRVYSAVRSSTSLPTDDQMRQARLARERLGDEIGRLGSIIDDDVTALIEQMDALGLPWSSGREIAMPEVTLPELPGRRR